MAVLRRFVAMVLLAVFGLPFVSSSLALGQDAEAGLPACCRRTGEHHCGMTLGERVQLAATGMSAWRAPAQKCPYSPAKAPASAHVDPGWLGRELTPMAAAWVSDTPVQQAECSHRLARERARHKRGPPFFPLA